MISSRRFTVWLLAAASLAAAGCGGDDALNSPTAKKLKGLASLYTDYAVSRKGAGPADEATFKKYVLTAPDITFQANNVEVTGSRDDLFVSDRDQQPFVVRYGVSIHGMSAVKAPVVAHEQTGQNGKQLVVFANMNLELVSGERLQELIAAH